jgi:hypothetical protein
MERRDGLGGLGEQGAVRAVHGRLDGARPDVDADQTHRRILS